MSASATLHDDNNKIAVAIAATSKDKAKSNNL